jgi:hypothetical protein
MTVGAAQFSVGSRLTAAQSANLPIVKGLINSAGTRASPGADVAGWAHSSCRCRGGEPMPVYPGVPNPRSDQEREGQVSVRAWAASTVQRPGPGAGYNGGGTDFGSPLSMCYAQIAAGGYKDSWDTTTGNSHQTPPCPAT